MDCIHHKGLHVYEDYFYPEILNPADHTACADGETGELVFTTLAKEGMPLIRYRTKDPVSYTHLEEIRARGLDPSKDLKVHIGLFGGEGMTEPMRDEMHKVWGEQFLCTQNYGMSELCGPGVAGECEELCGMHINEDWFIPEVINPETGEVLPPGERGAVSYTHLTQDMNIRQMRTSGRAARCSLRRFSK